MLRPSQHSSSDSVGRPLSPRARAFFEPRFAFDFSQVRVHADEAATLSARSVGAPAYTIGQDIFFATGRYDPESFRGRNLLAHELAHTIQQRTAASGGLSEHTSFRDSTTAEENEAGRAASAVMLTYKLGPLAAGADLSLARAPDDDAKLHDTEQFGDVMNAFKEHNSNLKADVLAKIRSGIIKLTQDSKTYEVGYSFFEYYSEFNHDIRQMTADEEKKARAADRKAETTPGVVFTTTTLRSDVLGYGDKELAALLLHEFSHTGHVRGDIAGGGSYQEGQSYGVEYFYAEIGGDNARMGKIQGIVSDADVLGYSKAADKPRFQEDFKVTYALLTGLREVVQRGSSQRMPGLTSSKAQLLEEQVVTSFQQPSGELSQWIKHVKDNLASFSIPPV
jgi:hypothetical protein